MRLALGGGGGDGTPLERAERRHDGPRLPAAVSSFRRDLLAVLAAFAGALGLIVGANVLADPYGEVGTGLLPVAVESDRAVKIAALDARAHAPEVLLLGSSRCRLADPTVLRALTGRDVFNGCVTGGDADDAWAIAHVAAARPGAAGMRVVWFVDADRTPATGVSPELAAVASARRFLPGVTAPRTHPLAVLRDYASLRALQVSYDVVRGCLAHGRCEGAVAKAEGRYGPDGQVLQFAYPPPAERRARIAADIARLVRVPSQTSDAIPSPRFAETMRWLAARGVVPLLVISPLHPDYLRGLSRHGFLAKRAMLRQLGALRRSGVRFVLVDAANPRQYGVGRDDFYDWKHVTAEGMSRLLAWLVPRSGGVLAGRAGG